MEDKQEICNALCKVLKMTLNQADMENLTYTKQRDLEYVTARYTSGAEIIITVTWNSGIVMIRDILKRLS